MITIDPDYKGTDITYTSEEEVRHAEYLNTVKKKLYKDKTLAHLDFIRKHFLYYYAILDDETQIRFEVPIKDMGDASFFPVMEARHLIRYLSN